MAQITEIIKLNPDRVPVNIKARVISLWASSREQVANEGRLEDSTGIIPFTLWKSSGIKKLEKGQQYLFHRAGLGKLDGELREKKIRDFFQGRQAMIKRAKKRKAATVSREGVVEEVLAGGVISVKVGEESWTIHYLGLDIPPLPVKKGAPFDPVALKALNYNKFLARGKNVRLEFEEWLPPEDGEARAYVFVGDQMLNTALLERGLARMRKEAGEMTYSDRLSQAEESAKSARKGIWR